MKYGSEHDSAFETVSDQIAVMMKSSSLKVMENWQHEMKMKSKLTVLAV